MRKPEDVKSLEVELDELTAMFRELDPMRADLVVVGRRNSRFVCETTGNGSIYGHASEASWESSVCSLRDSIVGYARSNCPEVFFRWEVEGKL